MTSRTRRRIGTVVFAPVAALITWACFRLASVDFAVSVGNGSVGAADVVAAASLGALGGWFVVRQLERHTERPWFWWPAIGSTALAVSTIGPSHLAHGASAAALYALHFVTGIIVITGLATAQPAHCDCCPARVLGGSRRRDPAP